MFGLAYLMVFGIYLLISIGVVKGAIGYARKNGRSAKKWGFSAAFVMYSIVFWDWIPTVAVHQYYCATESGFWVYKTLDQWKAENPGVVETLVANKGAPSTRQGDMENYTDTYLLNSRINEIVQQQQALPWLSVRRHEQTVVDRESSEVLARHVDWGSYNREWGGLRFWTSIRSCSEGIAHSQHDSYELRKQFAELEKQLAGRRK